jgi:murein DD-endopeptidase MepM/ murein hydrolase activator NlpD
MVTVVALPFLLALLLGVMPPTPALRIVPATPRQGQSLIVNLEREPERSRAQLSWDGRRYPIYRVGDGWRGVIPIRIQERPGTHTLIVSYTAAGGERQSVRRAVSVGRTPVRTQRLTMARKTERLYTYPGRKKELATVRRAVLTETPRQFWKQNFLIPIHGRYSTWFGERRIRNGRIVGYHMGLDIAAPQGTPIHADADGRVRLSQALTMHGKTVVIDHGLGVSSIFLHQSALRCREGQLVHRGDVIGEVGMTGVATGPHVHWSVYVHGIAVSPLFWTKLPSLR